MNAVLESGRAAAGAVHAPRLRVFQWLVRRELWEHRGIWLAPLICALIILFGAAVGQLHLGDPSPARAAADSLSAQQALGMAAVGLLGVGVPFYFVLLFTQFFYALNCLYEDRKDRSVLFWKSLPASDLETVLAKLFVASVVLPLVVAAFTLGTQLLGAGIAALRVDGVAAELARAFGPRAGEAAGVLVQALADPRLWLMQVALLSQLVVVYALWTLPIVGFALLVSAAVRRSPAVVGFLLPAAGGLAESLLFGSSWLKEQIGTHLFGAVAFGDDNPIAYKGSMPTGLAPVARHFVGEVTSLQLWSGVLLAVVFVACAIWARRYRDENT